MCIYNARFSCSKRILASYSFGMMPQYFSVGINFSNIFGWIQEHNTKLFIFFAQSFYHIIQIPAVRIRMCCGMMEVAFKGKKLCHVLLGKILSYLFLLRRFFYISPPLILCTKWLGRIIMHALCYPADKKYNHNKHIL